MSPSEFNDRLFIAFPLGWFAGLAAGTAWAIYGWTDLQRELGRVLLMAVTVSQIVTLLIVTLLVRRIISAQSSNVETKP